MADATIVQSGVEELIHRLRDDGVRAGKEEGEQVLEAARRKAARLVREAEAEGEALRARTAAEIEAERRAGHEALQLAVRDAVLDLKGQLSARFAAQVQRMVGGELQDPEFLRQLILTIAGRSVPERVREDADLEIVLEGRAGDDVTVEREDPLTRLTVQLASDALREGVEVTTARGHSAGIRVRLKGEDLEVDLTDQAVTQLLLEHLIPRFRALVEGAVR
jgi:V/A-type H+/Na+-transporting ATPase subunit E